jgi:hypothetical protein
MGVPHRRAERPSDRPARYRSCALDQSDACLGGRPRRKALHALPPQGRHRTAPHGRSWSHDAAHQRRTDRRAPGIPITSGSGAACPAGPGGPAIQGGRSGERVTGIVNAHGWVPPCLPRLWRGWVRQRLAPTGVGGASPVGHPFATGGRPAHAVGVRRCLTRWLGRAGNPLVGRWSRCRWDRRGGRYTSRGAAVPQGDGRGTPRPCTGWASIPSRAHARHGSAVRCLPCRGRALPDPPARGGLGMTDHGCGVQRTVRPTGASSHAAGDW